MEAEEPCCKPDHMKCRWLLHHIDIISGRLDGPCWVRIVLSSMCAAASVTAGAVYFKDGAVLFLLVLAVVRCKP